MAAPNVQVVRSSRSWATRALVVAAAIGVGLALQHVVASRLGAIEELARHDVVRARAELAGVLRIAAIGVFGLTGATGLALLASSRRALVEERFPPAGAFSWGTARVVTGPPARRLARVSAVLAVALIACSAAGAGVTWHMANVLLACQAR